MARWKTVAFAALGAVILNVSAVAQTGGPSRSGAPQEPGEPVFRARGALGSDRPLPRSAMNSERVRSTQEALKSREHNPGPIDGIFGPKTEVALRRFQKAENLQEPGRGDAQALSKLGVQ